MSDSPARPVFLDPSGQRWRRVRGAALAVSVAATVLAALLVAAVLIPPVLPAVTGVRAERETGIVPRWADARKRREHLAARRRLFATLDRARPAPAIRRERLPLPASAGANTRANATRAGNATARTAAPRLPVIAGFYVNWDDNSFASLRAHAADLDWVICEWAFLGARGDTMELRVDRRVPYLLGRLPEGARPLALAMISNYDRGNRRFDAARLRALAGSPAATRRVSAALADAVRRYGLAGIAIDFEEIPSDARPGLVRFLREVRAALDAAASGTGSRRPLLVQAVGDGMPAAELRAYSAVTDYTVLMLYDEHYGAGDAGPVASQSWYERKAASVTAAVPADKLVLAVGAYGYDWNDGAPGAPADEMTFQDVMTAARRSGRLPGFDRASGNPFLTWTDPDSTDHVAWYLDGVTAWNQIVAGRRLGVAGHALWRLGGEDPSLWRVLGRAGLDGPAQALAEIPAGYDVEFEGSGELLRIARRPTRGHRLVTVDSASGLVTDQRVTVAPTPYVVTRLGGDSGQAGRAVAGGRAGPRPATQARSGGRKIALTFDDGPDASWTAAILDTLRARRAPATFFVIGQNALLHPRLVRRIWNEGHEVGNHTYTHPNLALTSRLVTRLELAATERLLEALLDRRSAFFRPPYFGDAEPTTADELVPVGIASDLGYLTAGLHIDSEDWQQPSPHSIVDTVLAQRERGHVVLLHDGGGGRANTVAAVGPLIDSLRARGDTIVLLSGLIGLTRDQALPQLPPSGRAARLAELATYGALGAIEWGVTLLFFAAVVLGLGRLALVIGLAAAQRYRRRPSDPLGETAPNFLPSVSVVVPAYNEEKVIVRTVESLLAQDYTGELEIVVVDDGSPDDTYRMAAEAFGDHPRVTVLTKPNGGKASALNHGIARARGEIIVGLDADTLFVPATIRHLVAPLADPHVGAVAGNAKVGNRINLVTRWQAVEYVTSQNLDRRAFALLDCITVVPGAVGAWRRDLVLRAGGFTDDTLAEDQDLTLAISRLGYGIAYADRALAYTEAPDNVRGLAKQRFRWSFGTLQCMWKHRDAFLRARYGTLGLVAMPNVWLFQLVFAALSPLADLLFLGSLASVWLTWREHGATYAVTNLEQVLTFYAIFLLVDWVAAVLAFLMEPDEDRRLTWLILLQRFAYRQIMYWVVVRSFAAALRGRIVGWGKLERKATVEVPA